MAGPGGGPPRKSHTKSRNGCKTCKRRHIRCDETFPQCRNCTKHNCRCDYMDVQTAHEEPSRSPGVPNLMMTPDIEIEIENWRQTGVPPFPELSQYPRNDWYRLTRTDLRLIHHIAGLSIDFHRRGLSNSTVWASVMPCFLAIAVSSDFVMSAILAFSASHLAYVTGSKETKNLSYHYRGVAFKGLQTAIASFSKDNCDAILAASILLSWQATEWTPWTLLQKGISSVLDAMQPYWKESSEVAQYLEGQKALHCAGAAMSSTYLAGANRFQDDNIERIDDALVDLQAVQERVHQNRECYEKITALLDYVQQLRNDLPLQSPEKGFERLQPLRNWLFWLPTEMLRGGESDLCALTVLTHFFGTALVVEPLIPEIEGPYLGCMAVTPAENIVNIIMSRKTTHPCLPEVQLAASLMDFPRHIVSDYKNCVQWTHQHRPLDHFAAATPPSPYHIPNVSFATSSPSATSSYTTYTSSIHSPPMLAIPASPFNSPSLYAPQFSRAHLYIRSPLPSDPGDDTASQSDFSRPGTLEHSPAFSPYGGDLYRGGSYGTEVTGLNLGLLQESPMMPIGSVAPELWI